MVWTARTTAMVDREIRQSLSPVGGFCLKTRSTQYLSTQYETKQASAA